MARLSRSSAALITVVVALASISLVARPQEPAGVPVQFSVTVFDKNHQPVSGLAQSDFAIFADGKARAITSFHQVNADDATVAVVPPASTSDATWTREVPSDVVTNELPPGRLFALVIDDALIPRDSKFSANAKALALQLIDHLTPRDRMAVLFTSGQRAEGFTSDHDKLQTAVNSLRPGLANWSLGYSDFGFGLDDIFYQRSLQAVDDAANALDGDPHRTKVVVYVTPGVLIENPVTSFDIGMFGGIFLRGELDSQNAFHAQLADNWSRLLRDANRGNVPIYTIDPCGKEGLDDFVSARAEAIGTEPDERRRQLLEIAHRVSKYAMSYLDATATKTGGRAVVKTDDFAAGISAMFEDTDTHYVIGYGAADPTNGKFHEIKVTVNRPGVDVHTTSGYYAASISAADAPPPPPRPSSPNGMFGAMAPSAIQTPSELTGALPATGLSLRASVAPFAAMPGASPAIVSALDIQIPASATASTHKIAVQIDAFPGGVQLPMQLRQISAAAPAISTKDTIQVQVSPNGSAPFADREWLSRLDLTPGHYRVRLSARDEATGAAGSVFADVDLSGFVGAPASMSGVIIATDPAPAASGTITPFVPVAPSTVRAFTASDSATAFVRVYQTAAATVTFRVVTAAGASTWEHATTLTAPAAGKAASADVRVPLPLAKLTAGRYLLDVTAVSGSLTITRDVTFRIK